MIGSEENRCNRVLKTIKTLHKNGKLDHELLAIIKKHSKYYNIVNAYLMNPVIVNLTNKNYIIC